MKASPKLQKILTELALKALPPVLAFIGVLQGERLGKWANHHEATLLLVLFALVGSLLHPQLRHIVITSLCYGVAFLAARDIFFPLGLTGLHKELWQHVRMATLSIIALLTLSAAVTESFSPGTVWARRCYFGGAALYFLGTGVVNYKLFHSWQAIMMIITGCAAVAGTMFAGKIVEMEREDANDAPLEATAEPESTHAEHVRSLRAKEWHDPLDKQPQP